MTIPPPGAPAVDPQLLREVMRRFATGVAIVGAIRDGQPYAASVSSLTSVSLSPPLVLICLQLQSSTLEVIEETGAFSISVLRSSHEEHSRRFASSQPELDDPALELVDGLPVVRDVLAGMLCRVESVQLKGDHKIVIGEVFRTHHDQDVPLVYFGSAYHRIASPVSDTAEVIARK
jgi:flavin reductase (DIM6/NTAB) family NADH-FMN oxidoreductase RutF